MKEDDTRVSEPLAGKDQKAIAAEDSYSEFMVKRKAQSSRHPEKSLAESIAEVDGARRVEVIEHFIASVSQRL